MRPLRLEVSGLTCFREPTVIDFRELGLVAIEGATGAGKSSLLDAMMLALYGSVPRMGSRNLSELISHGRSGLVVTFDFAMRGQEWRVARTINRQRPSQAILSELVKGDDGEVGEKKKSSGVIEVQREVKSLLGIDVAAFQQAVILPQGKFQEFLQSTPGDRRKILSELLGFQVYATMRAKASEIATKLSAEVDVLARQLAGDLSLASEELVAELELQLGLARSEREGAQGALEAKRAASLETERAAAKCFELKVIDDALVVFQSREAEVAATEARIIRARAVAQVMPKVVALEAAAARASGLGARLGALELGLGASQVALEAATDAARDAEIAAEQIGALRLRIAALAEASGRFEQRDELVTRVATAKTGLSAARVAEDGAARQLGVATAGLEASAAQLAQLEALDVAAVAADEVARWEALRETASRLTAARAEHGREVQALTGAQKVAAQSEGALARAEVERKHKEHAELQADEALEAARVALAAAEHEARVGLVREHLHVGAACPVCEQVVDVVPVAVVGDVIDAAREEVAVQRNLAETARAGGERARARVAEARAKAQQAATRVSEVAAALERIAAALIADDAALGAVVSDEGPREVAFRRDLQALLARRDAHVAHLAALEARRTALARAGIEHERAAAAHSACVARAAELGAALGDAQERLAGVEATLAGLGAVDPKKERASTERVIATLDAKKTATQAKVGEAREQALRVSAEVELVASALAEARAELAAAEAALAESGWSADAVRAAMLADDLMQRGEAEVAGYRWARAAKTAEREAIVKALGPLRAGVEDVARAHSELEMAQGAAQAVADRVAILGERLRQANDSMKRADGVRAEHAQKVRELQVYRRVSDDLAPKNFQEFLLEEVIADLVLGASQRLFGLSGGRYRMAADSSAGFLVIDLDHAGDRRSTDTLSGGETFLASLAMALELSEQIRAKAGRIDLDCIFIDEGFGSLDPETLETVTEAVEGLQRPGRLVGIITHVSDLALRMPERLIVQKSQDGSSVRVARG